MKKRLRIGLAQEIGILAVALTILTISLSSIVSGRWYIGRMMSSLEDNVLNVVKVTAQSPILVEGLREAGRTAASRTLSSRCKVNWTMWT